MDREAQSDKVHKITIRDRKDKPCVQRRHEPRTRGVVRNPWFSRDIQIAALTLILQSPVMPTTRLSSRGQVVLPKRIREKHQLDAGQEFEIIDTDEGILLRPRSAFPQTTFEEVRGATGYDGPRVPTDRLTGAEALRRKKKRS